MGRPKKSKADKIRAMLAQGKTVAEVMKTTGASAAYVYAVKSKVKKAQATPVVEKEIVSPPQNVSPPPQNVSLLARIINRIAFWR